MSKHCVVIWAQILNEKLSAARQCRFRALSELLERCLQSHGPIPDYHLRLGLGVERRALSLKAGARGVLTQVVIPLANSLK